MSILYPKPILCNVLKELCAIRDNIITCDIASITDIIAIIEDICINYLASIKILIVHKLHYLLLSYLEFGQYILQFVQMLLQVCA